MAETSEEDIERIASRLAMVVSEDGEAANAGRALGQLARRLGLTGGDLKQIFMAGAASHVAPQPNPYVGVVERLEREITALRAGLRLTEANTRVVERERDALQYEISALRTTLDRRRTSTRLRRVVGPAVLVALLVAGVVGYFRSGEPVSNVQAAMQAAQEKAFSSIGSPITPAPARNLPPIEPSTAGPPPSVGGTTVGSLGTARMGVVHAPRAAVFVQPDRAAPVLATLRAGMPVVIRRLLWNMLVQWAEIDVGSSTGYVLTTDIDLS